MFKYGGIFIVEEIFGPEVTERSFKENVNHIIKTPINAIAEIIFNSWDAGAEEVDITWPDNSGGKIIIKDNGEGMTEEEFRNIWPKISYNRLKTRGKEVKFRLQREGYREAYGQHGKGRHSPFSFSDNYTVETCKDGEYSKFEISKDKTKGYVIKHIKTLNKDGNGTLISFNILDNYKPIDDITSNIGALFLSDPSFTIRINGKKVELADLNENVEYIDCKIEKYTVKILKIKTDQKTINNNFRGVTWVIGNIRIKTTAWKKVLDGRIEEASLYGYVVYSDILKDELNEQMNDFKQNENSKRIQKEILECIKNSVTKIMESKLNDVKKKVIEYNLVGITEMSSKDQDEVGNFISELQKERTAIKQLDLSAATEIFIKIKNSNNGIKFLNQLAKFDEEDIESLSKILDNWSIKQIRVVFDLIFKRIKLIEKLEQKTNDPNTLELEELQPLFEEGLWIFGPEYESIEFRSNKSLSTVARELFNKKKIDAKKSRLRPDFVVLPDSSLGLFSNDKYNDDGEPEGIEKILFIELKRGGHVIDLDERTQVEKYINILIDGGAISSDTKIDAYVLGSKVKCRKADVGDKNLIRIIPLQYHNILNKAEKRLLNLRKKLEEAKQIKDVPTDLAIKESLAQSTLDLVDDL